MTNEDYLKADLENQRFEKTTIEPAADEVLDVLRKYGLTVKDGTRVIETARVKVCVLANSAKI